MTCSAPILLNNATRRRIFFSLYSAVFSTMIGVGIVIPLLPRYVATMGATGLWVGVIFSGFALSRALFLPIFSRISDSMGRRRIILIGLCAYSVISLAYTLAANVMEITIIRLLHGAASAMVLPIALAYIGDISPVGEEGRFVGSFTSSIYLGMSLGPLLGGVMFDLFNMSASFLSMTCLSVFAMVTCILFLPDIVPGPSLKSPIRAVLMYRPLRGPLVYQIMYAFANGTFMVFVPIIAVHLGEMSASLTGVVILVSVLSTALFQQIFGRFSDQFGRYNLIALGTAMIGISLLALPFYPGFYPYLVFALLMGIGRALSLPAMFALVTVAGREVGQGSATGLVNTTLAVGLIIAPLISGMVMDLSGLFTVFYLSGVISLLSVFLFIRMGREEKDLTITE